MADIEEALHDFVRRERRLHIKKDFNSGGDPYIQQYRLYKDGLKIPYTTRGFFGKKYVSLVVFEEQNWLGEKGCGGILAIYWGRRHLELENFLIEFQARTAIPVIRGEPDVPTSLLLIQAIDGWGIQKKGAQECIRDYFLQMKTPVEV